MPVQTGSGYSILDRTWDAGSACRLMDRRMALLRQHYSVKVVAWTIFLRSLLTTLGGPRQAHRSQAESLAVRWSPAPRPKVGRESSGVGADLLQLGLGAGHNDVWHQPRCAQFLDAVLGRLSLLRTVDHWYLQVWGRRQLWAQEGVQEGLLLGSCVTRRCDSGLAKPHWGRQLV